MKKVLVTGAAGFIGSNLVDYLLKKTDWKIVAWDNFSIGKNILSIDVENVNVGEFICEDNFDIIFHLAGFSRIQPSFNKPTLVHTSNVAGTFNILELARRNKAKVIYAGSSSAYGNMDINDTTGPYKNPYSFTKWVGEEYCRMYQKVYDLPIAIARFFNVYGLRQPERGEYATVIGIFEKQKREGRPLTVTGTGEQRRDFCHVYDIIRGLKIMAETNVTEICNLGTGMNYSINEVAAMFGGPVEYLPKRMGESEVTLAKPNPEINWKAEINLSNYVRESFSGASNSCQ